MDKEAMDIWGLDTAEKDISMLYVWTKFCQIYLFFLYFGGVVGMPDVEDSSGTTH